MTILLLIVVKLLALALTNLVLDLANLVNSLAKPSCKIDIGNLHRA